jgi:hypothetical protein
MKRINNVIILLSMCTLLFSACEKSKDDKALVAITGETLTMKLDGSSKTGITNLAAYSNVGKVLLINGMVTTTENVSLTLEAPKAGTFTVGTGLTDIIYTVGNNYYEAEKGSIIITSFSTTAVKGTFSGTLSSLGGTKKVVTDGAFNLKVITN